MGYYCTVPQCTSLAGKTKNVKFHRFPRDLPMADRWNMILKRGKPYTKYSKVCSLHFTQADYNVTTMGQWKTLSKDAVPSQNLPKLNPDGSVMVIRKSRTVKYKESRKEDNTSDKINKWSPLSVLPQLGAPHEPLGPDSHDANLQYRVQTLANTLAPPIHSAKPKKQDAIMQTDPQQLEDEDQQPNTSTSDTSETSYHSEAEYYTHNKKPYEAKDYTKPLDDYIPQTNEEYNKEAEKYALERKSHNGYEKIDYQKLPENGYKVSDVYTYEKDYQRDNYGYQGYDSVDVLRNQQHNLQILQEQHRVAENQNFFNENHIKQELDLVGEEDKFLYERTKEQLDSNMFSEGQRRIQQQRLLVEQLQNQLKQEPDVTNVSGCDSVLQPQSSPYYPPNGHNNIPGSYLEAPRPGPELLIAKQNALAAHPHIWQNTMKRPFFYSDTSHYNTPQLLHRYEDIPRILQ